MTLGWMIGNFTVKLSVDGTRLWMWAGSDGVLCYTSCYKAREFRKENNRVKLRLRQPNYPWSQMVQTTRNTANTPSQVPKRYFTSWKIKTTSIVLTS